SAVLGFAMFVNDWLEVRKVVPVVQAPPRPDVRLNFPLVAVMFAVLGAYVIALPYVGFRIATFAYVAVTNGALSPPKTPRHWARVLILALATAFLTHLRFE